MTIRTLLKNRGFTLIELLVVISIISILSSIVLSSIKSAKQKANDSGRVQVIKSFEAALDLYYAEHGKYPGWNNGGSDVYPAGTSVDCYTDYWSNNSCEVRAWSGIVHDNSASSDNGFLKVLYEEGFIREEKWNDPLNPTIDPKSKLKWSCRYAVPENERDKNNVQNYMLYCRVEGNSYAAKNDGGFNPKLFEVQRPEPWMCAIDNDDIDTDPVCN